MPTINTGDLYTLRTGTAGTWTIRTCGAITQPFGGQIIAGTRCTFNSGGIYEDSLGDCYECVGSSYEEIRILKNGLGQVLYQKIEITFDSNGGSSVSNKFVYYGNSRTYGTLPTPTKSGYDFDGWFNDELNDDGVGTQIVSTSEVVVTPTDSQQTLYAKWVQQVQQTATPTINTATQGKPPLITQGYTVTNNDGSTAEIKAESSDSTPDVIINSALASGATTSFQTLSCQPGSCGVTVYATAQASGETLSNVASFYFD